MIEIANGRKPIPNLCPKVVLEGTRMTHKTDIALSLNEHPRFLGPRKYRYHWPIISAECGGIQNEAWGQKLTAFDRFLVRMTEGVVDWFKRTQSEDLKQPLTLIPSGYCDAGTIGSPL